MDLSKGDVVLVEFPFTDLSQTKLRPAIVLSVSVALNEVTLCFISSQNVSHLTSAEFALKSDEPEFLGTGLRVSSKVRVTRMITLQHQLIQRRIGKLSSRQIQQLDTLLIQAFQLTV
ncbi:MAG: type II toxin-antitoxin system PemK/MazF family toxin [Cyanobacteria bacterium CRU_2_1]|nr:type II toxin-antitoxin system PemK/MazF family toxin [Cyanobacteria bacterium RU_5_0]NJR57887.1 type II toxin-antitoxin system PemK/MazF family toxin [Cyanobacteria bacterium CRU_2_1]